MASYLWALGLLLTCACIQHEPVCAQGETPSIVHLGAVDLPMTEQMMIADKIENDSTLESQIEAEGEAAMATALSGRQQRRGSRRKMNRHSAAYVHSRHSRRRHMSQAMKKQRHQRNHASIFYSAAFRALVQRLGLTPAQVRWVQSLVYKTLRPGTPAARVFAFIVKLLSHCPDYANMSQIQCDTASPFRRIDGSCNNLRQPQYGMAGQPFERFVPADYEDGEGQPRTTSDVDGLALPNVRNISLTVHTLSVDNSPDLDDKVTHMVMQWGQFLDHDFTLAPMADEVEPEEGDASPIEPLVCCVEDEDGPVGDLSVEVRQAENRRILDTEPDCISFSVDPVEDTAFNGRTCHPLIRSAPTPIQPSMDARCGLSMREQFNVLTAYVDGSQVYGSDEHESQSIRSGVDGLLATQQGGPGIQGQTLPPPRPREDCLLQEPQPCLLAGEERVNENPGLATLHVLFVREHNRIATLLKQKNPHILNSADADERIFQEARKIVIAELQKITYDEFLPTLVDESLLQKFGLKLEEVGFFTGYNPSVNAGIRNEFATAAYRLGHTLIRDSHSRLRRQGSTNPFPALLMRDNFERIGNVLTNGGPNSIARGLAHDASQGYDRKITTEVRDHLFQTLATGSFPSGLDLIAINNQRGRDHGIPSYIHFRRLCNMTNTIPTTFDELVDHDEQTREALRQAYRNVGDIDLFTGGISETLNRGSGIVGPTFACMVARQMEAAKFGDRFYFETNNRNLGFSERQLNEIRSKATLASVLCRNGNFRNVQPNPFLQATVPGNHAIHCRNFPGIDLDLFHLA